MHVQAKGLLCKRGENISIHHCFACVHIGSCPAQIHSHCIRPCHRNSMHVRIHASTVMQSSNHKEHIVHYDTALLVKEIVLS